MTKNFLYLATAIVAMLFVACSNDNDNISPPVSNTVEYAPVMKTRAVIASNGYDLSDEAIITWEQISTTSLDRAAERKICEEVLPELQGNVDKITTDFLFYAKDGDMEFEFYPVYANSGTVHDLGIFYYDIDGNMHSHIIWEQMDKESFFTTENKPGGQQEETCHGIKITVKQGYKFGFYWNGSLNGGKPTTYYTSADMNEPVICTDGYGYNILPYKYNQIHAGTFVRNGKTYLGIEDWTDFDYQDLVFTCNKEIATVDADSIIPTPVPTPDPTPDPTPEPTPDPVDTIVSNNGGSVEVNLALNDEKEYGDWIESHLSIHVRDTTDVTVYLPVEAEYYCEMDDMAIILKHDEDFIYKETTEVLSMQIGEYDVTLTIVYSANGVTISTSGINAEILKYCREKYNDGITFEVYNYYNSALDREQLQAKLNNSTISFTNATKVYVNAFGYVDGAADDWACVVKPTDMEDRTLPPAEGVMSEREKSILYIYIKE